MRREQMKGLTFDDRASFYSVPCTNTGLTNAGII